MQYGAASQRPQAAVVTNGHLHHLKAQFELATLLCHMSAICEHRVALAQTQQQLAALTCCEFELWVAAPGRVWPTIYM